jgi:hypothetical protein
MLAPTLCLSCARGRRLTDHCLSRAPLVLASVMLAACAYVPAAPPPSAGSLASPAPAAAEPLELASGAVFVGCGFLSIENHGDTHFTALLRADHAQQIKKNGTAFLLDNVVVEVTSTTAREMGASDLRGRSLLLKHMDWEAHYLNGLPAWRGLRRPEIGEVPLGVPFPTLAWLARPTGDAEVLGQKITALLYVSAAINDVIFVLAAPVRSPRELEEVGSALGRILKTLHETPDPTDVVALSTALKESPAPWSGCANVN